jgi:transposase-like protein
MMSNSNVGARSRKGRRRLSPAEKYEIFVQVLTGQATQREAADAAGVDRSTVVHICRTAKRGALDALAASVPGRPGVSPEQAVRQQLQGEVDRLRATVAEQAVALHLHEGKSVWG